jgi:uncharacterized membrane protein YczE
MLLGELPMGVIIGAAIGLVIAATATSAVDTPAARRGQVVAAAIGLVLAGAAISLAIASR